MDNVEGEFLDLVAALLERFLAQNAERPPSPAAARQVAARLWTIVRERGLPRPLDPGEIGTPGGWPEAEVRELGAQVAGPAAGPVLGEAARQLVKACFYPEFKVCRDSFRAVAADGTCRRQELARVRGRISGTHCVDCPHWVGASTAAHADLLAAEWRGDPVLLAEHRGIFLPDDFGALRRWLHAAARREPRRESGGE